MSYNPWAAIPSTSSTSVAAIPPGAPQDINSPEYALWYQAWLAQYQQAIHLNNLQLNNQQSQQSHSIQPVQSVPLISTTQQAQPPLTKMQKAMAELAAKSSTNTQSSASPSKLQNQEMLAKAAQFKPQSKKPLYIPVKTGTTSYADAVSANLTAPAPATPSQLSQLKMKNFVDRVFAAAGASRRAEAEGYLGPLIKSIQTKGAIETTDWDKMGIPAFLQTDPGDPKPTISTTTTGTKRKKFSLDLLEDRGNVPVSPTSSASLLKPKHPKLTSSTDDSTISPSSAASSPALDSLPAHLRAAEVARREERAKRFQSGDATSSAKQKQKNEAKAARERALMAAAIARGEENKDVIDWDEYTIVGLCQKLEKSYLRLTSAPDPATVRPLPVLRKTLDLLGQKWKQDQNYTYICDQFKSLRQDLTVQRIKNEFTVKVYESHARIALEKGDVGEYNQCQAQLKELYRLGLPGSKDEFLGYRILYMVYTLNRTEQVKILSDLTPPETQSPPIRHALGVRMAVSTGDYHTLFQLYNTCPYMSVYLMDLFLERERVKALKTLSRAFRPSLRVAYLAGELGFVVAGEEGEGEERRREGVLECWEWLKGLGAVFVPGPEVEVEVTLGKGKKAKVVKRVMKKEVGWEDVAVDMKASVGVFLAKMNEVVGKGVDIKGQIA